MPHFAFLLWLLVENDVTTLLLNKDAKYQIYRTVEVDLQVWQLILKHFATRNSSLFKMLGLKMEQKLHLAKHT
jgi:hypothetical protein